MKHFLLLAAFLTAVSVDAQQLKGRVADAQGEPIAFANVVLLRADSTFVSGNVSDEAGNFSLDLAGNPALLKVSYIGYQDAFVSLTGETDLGTVQLQEAATALGEVVVRGTIPVTRLKGDALVTSVENSVLAKVGSANDVLAKVPGVLKKGKDFEVFGKGAPLIYINGREVRNPQELEQLDSDEIRSVEVIRNPGARYDATVNAVIRIRTVRRQGDGFGVDLRSSYYQSSENADWLDQLDLNYRHNDLDLFATMNYSLYHIYATSDMTQQNSVGELWEQRNLATWDNEWESIQGTFGFNYLLHENHSFGMRYDLLGRPRHTKRTIWENEVQRNGVFYDCIHSDGLEDANYNPEHTLNAYYNGKAGEWGIDFNADYYRMKQDILTSTTEESQEAENRLVQATNPVENQLAAAKLVFSHPLWGGEVSFGSEYTYTTRTDNYLSQSPEYVPTVYSKIREHNVAAFVEYAHSFPFGDIAVGARYEHDAFDYYENHQHSDAQSRTFDNVYPTVSYNTTLGRVQLQASYAAKTERPSYWMLRNNVSYYNRFTLQTGDPSLLPSLKHDVTLSGTWKFLQTSVSFQQTNDALILWGKPKADKPEISVLQPINFDHLPVLTASVSASPTIGCWSPMLNLGVSKQWMKVESNQQIYEMNHPMMTLTFNNLVTLPKGFSLGVDFSYQTGGDQQNAYWKGWSMLNISLRKSFFDDALTVELRGNDLFHQFTQKQRIYYERLTGTQVDEFDTREFGLTLRYKFNATQRKYKGTGAGSEQRRRF